MLRSKIIPVLLVLGLVVALAGCGASPADPDDGAEGEAPRERETLVVTTWSGPYEASFRAAIVEPFEREFGVTVEVVPGWDEFLPRIQVAPAGNPPYDVFLLDEYFYPLVKEGGYLEELDLSLIPNHDQLYDSVKGHDPYVDRLAMPFEASSAVFIFRADLVDEPARTWQELLDPRFERALTFDPNLGYNVTIADIMLGRGTMYEDMEAIFDKMKEFAGQIRRWYEGGAEFYSLLERGEVVGGYFYAGSASRMLREATFDVHVVNPEDGTFGYFNYLGILKGTDKYELAHEFINYALDAEVMQRFMEMHGVSVTNKNVTVPPELRDFVYSTEEQWDDLVLTDWAFLEDDYASLDERLQREVISLAQ